MFSQMWVTVGQPFNSWPSSIWKLRLEAWTCHNTDYCTCTGSYTTVTGLKRYSDNTINNYVIHNEWRNMKTISHMKALKIFFQSYMRMLQPCHWLNTVFERILGTQLPHYVQSDIWCWKQRSFLCKASTSYCRLMQASLEVSKCNISPTSIIKHLNFFSLDYFLSFLLFI
jgi:hypothetical protein